MYTLGVIFVIVVVFGGGTSFIKTMFTESRNKKEIRKIVERNEKMLYEITGRKKNN